jgi:hypothetical protein
MTRPKQITSFFVIALFVLAFSDCAVFENKSDLSAEPKSNDFVGRWIITEDSTNQLQRWDYPILSKSSAEDNFIELKADGTCVFKTYWAFQNDYYHIHANGTWALEKRYADALLGDVWSVEFTLEPSRSQIIGTHFYIKGSGKTLALFQYAGDPDYGKTVGFKKQ